MNNSKSVAVAMSGGVDSSVTAALLYDRGYEVQGFTFLLWDPDETEDESQARKIRSAAEDAAKVCDKIGIKHHVVDLSSSFAGEVIEYFDRQYLAGKTPNPCVHCNSVIKWQKLREIAQHHDLDLLATGHYAKTVIDEQGKGHLLKARDLSKDQSYFLWKIPVELFSRTILPLHEFTKKQIREIARDMDLPVAERAESLEVCFIPNDDYRAWLVKRYPEIEQGKYSGEMLDRDGSFITTHPGYPFFTIGQRKGLGVGGGKKYYVTDIDAVEKKIHLGDVDDLLTNRIKAAEINILNESLLAEDKLFTVKIRYRDKGVSACVNLTADDILEISTVEPVSAVTPGQSVVIYDEDEVIGGGTIM